MDVWVAVARSEVKRSVGRSDCKIDARALTVRQASDLSACKCQVDERCDLRRQCALSTVYEAGKEYLSSNKTPRSRRENPGAEQTGRV